jgi:hypothetical protein
MNGGGECHNTEENTLCAETVCAARDAHAVCSCGILHPMRMIMTTTTIAAKRLHSLGNGQQLPPASSELPALQS